MEELSRLRAERQSLNGELRKLKAEMADKEEAFEAERRVSEVSFNELRQELANTKRLLQREKDQQSMNDGALEVFPFNIPTL